jgi:hypothetical protein
MLNLQEVFYQVNIYLELLWSKMLLFRVISTSVLFDSLMIVPYLNIIIQNITKDAIVIAILLYLRRSIRLILDFPSGVVSDKIGVHKVIFLAIIFKIAFLLCLLKFDKNFLFLAIIFEGISISLFRNKINIWQYHQLDYFNKKDDFYICNSWYNVYLYSFTLLTSFVGNFMINYDEMILYKISIFSSIIILLIDLSLIVYSFKFGIVVDKMKNEHNSKSVKFWYISTVNSAKYLISDKKILSYSVTLGLCCLGWQINMMNQFLAMEVSSKFSIHIFQYGLFAMLIGSLINLFIKNYNVKIFNKIFIIILVIITISPLLFSKEIVVYFTGLYLIFFMTFENVLKTTISRERKNKLMLSTILSFAGTITTMFSILLVFVYHILGGYFGYLCGYFWIFLFMTVFILLSYRLSNLTT